MDTLNPILLVEDSSMDVELITAALEDARVANPVIVMRDGAKALEYLRRHVTVGDASYPAVILLDIKMPRISGIELLSIIKADPTLRQLPIVVLTSSREQPDISECYRLGANAYVVKPVESAQFFEAVKAVGRFWAVVNQPPESKKGEEGSCAVAAAGRV